MTERAMGVTRACGLVGISRSLFCYESRRRVDDETLTGRMMAIAAQKRRYGYRRIHVLLQREGCFANHKRIWRLYSKAGLSVRKRRRKRIAAVERMPLPLPTGPNQSWSMDFVSDGLAYGRRFRCLNVVDDYTRECLAIEVDTSLPGLRVQQVLERLKEMRGLPASITVDNVLNASRMCNARQSGATRTARCSARAVKERATTNQWSSAASGRLADHSGHKIHRTRRDLHRT
ncbi:MAG: DDE-type integrase/transposase/recombinase [Burkholderia contaminans]|uniref:IS3 family transposase n=1 Tax=Burkholderia contaminans TaxID=488447 RepID=A0AAP4QZU4_9BURK|nr:MULTISPECIES: DDE-type integrase/transposase/recombinase [Burkholderia]MBD1410620.1 transposase [Burkholderia contaminans]MBH9668059.1 transposase [Burkholderia contaminans]MBH9678226.1 transposase [Burkholderia contaminans]MBH9705345.1 transposase [Burkholderia contaminans]MBH9721849.1 transposase [Burkholderia contaminans]